jgi:hypothetical protein
MGMHETPGHDPRSRRRTREFLVLRLPNSHEGFEVSRGAHAADGTDTLVDREVEDVTGPFEDALTVKEDTDLFENPFDHAVGTASRQAQVLAIADRASCGLKDTKKYGFFEGMGA